MSLCVTLRGVGTGDEQVSVLRERTVQKMWAGMCRTDQETPGGRWFMIWRNEEPGPRDGAPRGELR